MKTEMTTCSTFQTHMPDLLLDPETLAGNARLQADLQQHLATCAPCRTELAELRSTFAALDEFTAPEPSPFFDSRLQARVRELQRSEPESLMARLRGMLQFHSGRSFRPALAGALALVVALSAGSYFGVHSRGSHQPSATVNDLRVLDNNQQAEQDMGALLDESGSEDGDSPVS